MVGRWDSAVGSSTNGLQAAFADDIMSEVQKENI